VSIAKAPREMLPEMRARLQQIQHGAVRPLIHDGPEMPPQSGDYIRIDWTISGDRIDGRTESDRHVWVEGEVMRVHRLKLDLVADVRVDRSNWLQVGSVAGIGIEHTSVRRIPRPGDAAVSREAVNALSVLASVACPTDIDAAAMLRERFGLSTQPPPRPDGFSQSAVDAAKAVLLAPVPKRGGKR
jgi:hypothetical protein